MHQNYAPRRGVMVLLVIVIAVALLSVFLTDPTSQPVTAASAATSSNGWELVFQAPAYDSGKGFHFYNMTFVSRDLGFAYGGDEWSGKELGRIYRTKNGGATWQEVYRGGGWKIGMACADASRCWVGGKNGRVDYTTDGGNTWNKANTYTWYGMDLYPTPAAPTPVPFSAWIRSAGITTDGSAVLFGATDNTILRSTDGVNFYNYWPLFSWYSATWSVTCSSATKCFGGQIKRLVVRSDDGGANWIRAAQPGAAENESNCLSVEFPPEGIQRRYYGLSFANENLGWMVGSCGALYRTVNGAQGWQTQNAGISLTTQFRRVQALSKTSVVAIGGASPSAADPSIAQNAVVYRSIDGVTWLQVAAPDTSELHGLAAFADATFVADWSGNIWRWNGSLAPVSPTQTPTPTSEVTATPTETLTPTATPTETPAPTATPTGTGSVHRTWLPLLMR